MADKIKSSLKNINFKQFWALIILGLCPTVYTTVRVFFLGQLPGDWSFSIAGQLSWVNLIYEVISEAIIFPLFFFIGKVKNDKKAFSNRMRTGMLVSLGTYAVLSVIIFIFAEQLLTLMATDESILTASASYIRIESVANVFSILAQFALVALVSVNKSRYLYILTGARLILSLALDTFLVSTLPVSFNLGVNGIGYSNIITNLVLLVVSLYLLHKEGIKVFAREKLDFGWLKEFVKIGGISGVESLVRNVAYMVMVARMVNVVGE
ncbi:MAG: multidrug transporter, partial [Clostridia bacterium]|nr:multidrug transporter [Clostridia bacterium]